MSGERPNLDYSEMFREGLSELREQSPSLVDRFLAELEAERYGLAENLSPKEKVIRLLLFFEGHILAIAKIRNNLQIEQGKFIGSLKNGSISDTVFHPSEGAATISLNEVVHSSDYDDEAAVQSFEELLVASGLKEEYLRYKSTERMYSNYGFD